MSTRRCLCSICKNASAALRVGGPLTQISWYFGFTSSSSSESKFIFNQKTSETHLVQICLIGLRAFIDRIVASLIPSNYKHAVSHWIPWTLQIITCFATTIRSNRWTEPSGISSAFKTVAACDIIMTFGFVLGPENLLLSSPMMTGSRSTKSTRSTRKPVPWFQHIKFLGEVKCIL